MVERIVQSKDYHKETAGLYSVNAEEAAVQQDGDITEE